MLEIFADQVGSKLGEAYRSGQHVVSHKSGPLYRVQHKSNGQYHLLRILDIECKESGGAGEAFESFLAKFDRIRHPKIHAILKTGVTSDDRRFVISADVEGEPLETVLETNQGLPFQTAIELALSIASSLKFAYDLNIVHGNLCPANVFVRKYKKRWQLICLLGFEIHSLASDASNVEPSGHCDPQYTSPEQLKGEPLDQSSDIYSIGCLLYRLCTGQAPPAVSLQSVDPLPVKLDKWHSFIEKSPSELQFPVGLKEIILRCLEVNRENRYKDISELEKDLLSVRAAVKIFPVWLSRHVVGVGLVALIIAAVTLSSMTMLMNQALGRIETSFLIPQIGLKKAVYRSSSARTMQDAIAEAVSKNASLEGANLYGVNLSGMNLKGAQLRNAYISGLLIDTDLSRADLTGATLEHCKGVYSKLRGAKLENATIKNCDFAFSDFTDVDVKKASFSTMNLYHAKTSGTTFDTKQSSGVYFEGARRVHFKDQ